MKATSMEIFGVILMLISAHFGWPIGTDWNCGTGLIGTGTSGPVLSCDQDWTGLISSSFSSQKKSKKLDWTGLGQH
jgi:hypothetical protein